MVVASLALESETPLAAQYFPSLTSLMSRISNVERLDSDRTKEIVLLTLEIEQLDVSS
jgi:hypothetical protein